LKCSVYVCYDRNAGKKADKEVLVEELANTYKLEKGKIQSLVSFARLPQFTRSDDDPEITIAR
jgi:hypothetical protein